MTLREGDLLLYRGRGLFSRLIQIKTWSRYSHCEVFDGAALSLASRDGDGVGRYPYRADVAMILRPVGPVDMEQARAWFETVDGQGYDWFGLLAFFSAKWQGSKNQKMFCSEFAVRLYRAGGFEPFTPHTDADAVAPGEFLKCPRFMAIWKEG